MFFTSQNKGAYGSRHGWAHETASSMKNGNGNSRKASRGEETLLFAKNFLQHPKMLGSLIPSSRFLIGRLLDKVDWSRAGTIVEYGPGVGTITAGILSRMQPRSR